METAVVVEDEQNVRLGLIAMIHDYCPSVKVIGEAANVADGYKQITEKKPDIVFMDVRLPDGSGFDLLSKIVAFNPKVIFVTAYGDYALQAIKYSAIDYLLKPVIPDELIDSVEKACHFIKQEKEYYELSSLNEFASNNSPKKIVIKTKTNSFYPFISDIIYCKADGNYTHIILRDDKPIMVAKTLKFYSDILSEHGFIRAHQSFLVNPVHVIGIHQDTLSLSNGDTIDVSRRKKSLILSQLKSSAK
jgi:two-component system LytT family response regulator